MRCGVLISISAIQAVLAISAAGQIAPTGPGFRYEFLAELSVSEDHLLRLAEAIPAEMYTWRPASEVRSVSEVLLHIAGSNFNLPRVLGVIPPEGMVDVGYDRSTTDKVEVLVALRESFTVIRDGVETLDDADAEKTLPWFGGKTTFRGVLYFMARHTGEHTGQLIAYARTNGIVPPWS